MSEFDRPTWWQWLGRLGYAAAIAGTIATTHHQPAAAQPQEDQAGWNCATMGNHICGPANSEGLPAGCYDSGTLIIPWSNYAEPRKDVLWARTTSPCAGMAPSQEQESDKAYAAAVCGSDSDCADYDRAHGRVPNGYGTTNK